MQRHLRLRHRNDFALLRAEGQTCHHRLCVLSYRLNGLAHNRYGFIVVRHIGNAVQRNRVRRRMREILRLRHPAIDTHTAQGYDLVWIARQPIGNATFDEIASAIDELLHCAHLLPSSN